MSSQVFEISVFNSDRGIWEPGPKDIWAFSEKSLRNLLNSRFTRERLAGKTIRVVNGLDCVGPAYVVSTPDAPETDETCCGYSNWDTFTVILEIDNTPSLYSHVLSATSSMDAEQATVWLRNDPRVASWCRAASCDLSRVNWYQVGQHVTERED